MEISATARSKADAFVDRQTQFQLGFLPTEQSHPETAGFRETAGRDPSEGVKTLVEVDCSMAALASRVLASPESEQLRDSVRRVLASDGRIYFAGCGASGRMSLELEALWRRAFRSFGERRPKLRERCLSLADRAHGITAGGELAVIQSVEYFEDHELFGRRQVREAGVGPRDLFITLGEAGIAWSTIGMALEAEERGADTYFFYCNPRSLMEEKLERCRLLFSRERIVFVEAAFGPMALSGSTRMQAVSLELICIGYALEWAVASWGVETGLSDSATPRTVAEFADEITTMLSQLSYPAALSAVAGSAGAEAEIYRRGGLVTYFADSCLFDILCDTTERTPTFALPSFARSDRPSDEPSWAFAKHPRHSTQDAWADLLQRPPVGLRWGPTTYRELHAPRELIEAPPDLTARACYSYAIGNETDPARFIRHPAIAVWVESERDLSSNGIDMRKVPEGFDESYTLRIGEQECAGVSPRFIVPLTVPTGPLSIAGHLAVKLVFNAISTTTAALLGRIEGNWMVQVLPTNKKLIDRSIRIIAQLRSLSYREAAYRLFAAWERVALPAPATGAAGELPRVTLSPVAAALYHLDD